jgi:integrase
VKANKTSGKRKRAARGSGRLFKKSGGRQLPADSTATGNFYLTYMVNGKRETEALRDDEGHPITDRTRAEAERRRILAPFAAGDRLESLKAIRAQLADAETIHAEAVENAAVALKLADAWQAFAGHPNRPQCGESTLAQYNAEFKRFGAWMAIHHPGAVTMKAVTEEHATGYATDLDAAKVSASTFNQHRNFLVMLWRVLRADAHLLGNPFETIARRKLQTLARRKRALEPQEYEAILAAAAGDQDLHDLFVMLAWTGQRLVDVVKMRWQSVDFRRGILTMHPQKTAARTGKAVHPPLFPAAREVLNRRQDPGKAFKLSGFVFPELAAEYDRDRGATLSKRIGRILGKAGLQTSAAQPGTTRAAVQYGAHSFRHFFVTQAAAAGMPAAMIKQITGHATDEMLEHYQHIGAGFSEELARRIGNGTLKALPAREPLPGWARELVEGMNGKNWKAVKATILEGGAK